MEISQIIPHIEVLIFASDKPLTSVELLELVNGALGFLEDKASEEQVAAATEAIREKYSSEFYPFEIRESGGGWQFLTKKEYHKTVALIGGDKFLKRLSPAAMETLAIIAYKQPITKGEIEAIRGVSSDYSVQKLLEKELIVITGRNEELPGKPLVYATSKSFMDYFGLNNASELPSIKEILMDQAVAPYVVTQDKPVESDRVEDFPTFSVNGSGDLVDDKPGTGRKAQDADAEDESQDTDAEDQDSDSESLEEFTDTEGAEVAEHRDEFDADNESRGEDSDDFDADGQDFDTEDNDSDADQGEAESPDISDRKRPGSGTTDEHEGEDTDPTDSDSDNTHPEGPDTPAEDPSH